MATQALTATVTTSVADITCPTKRDITDHRPSEWSQLRIHNTGSNPVWVRCINVIPAATSRAITSLARVTNVVTATFAAGVLAAGSHTLAIGTSVLIAGTTDATFHGTFTLVSVGATTVTWANTDTNGVATGGTMVNDDVAVAEAAENLYVAPTTGVVTVNWQSKISMVSTGGSSKVNVVGC